MNKLVAILLLLNGLSIFGQINCKIKLIDSYSYDQINTNNSLQIKNADFSIDTLSGLVIINKFKGKRLEISLKDYELYSEKISFGKYKNDTIARQLIPKKQIILSRFEQIWNNDNIMLDTLTFDNSSQGKRHVLSYLNYVKILDNSCDNGLCNYANTYSYNIRFTKENDVYKISTIDKLKPHEYNCNELENYLNKLKMGPLKSAY